MTDTEITFKRHDVPINLVKLNNYASSLVSRGFSDFSLTISLVNGVKTYLSFDF